MNRILIVGSGDIALRTIPLLGKGNHLFALVRNPAQLARLRESGATPILGDLDDRTSLGRLAGLADVVVHLAPPDNVGERDLRTRHLLAALSRGAVPRRLLYISTSGVYGDCAGAVVNETRPPQPQSARGRRRVDAERQIRAWAARNGVQAGILRVPGIYAAERLPLERIRQATPAITSAEDSYTNHIHADDLARIIVAALRHGKPNRVYHAVDDGEMKMGDYFDAVADACGLPRPPRVSRAEAQLAVSAMLWSFMSESRRLTNRRMKRELKVLLTYPRIEHALKSIGRTDPM